MWQGIHGKIVQLDELAGNSAGVCVATVLVCSFRNGDFNLPIIFTDRIYETPKNFLLNIII